MGCCNKPKLLVFELSGEIKPYFADSKYKQKIFRNNQNKQKENFGLLSAILFVIVLNYRKLWGKHTALWLLSAISFVIVLNCIKNLADKINKYFKYNHNKQTENSIKFIIPYRNWF